MFSGTHNLFVDCLLMIPFSQSSFLWSFTASSYINIHKISRCSRGAFFFKFDCCKLLSHFALVLIRNSIGNK